MAHYLKDFPEFAALRVGDTYAESETVREGDVDDLWASWRVEYVKSIGEVFLDPNMKHAEPVVVVSTAYEGERYYKVLGEGDWIGCSVTGTSVLDCLAGELLRVGQWGSELLAESMLSN